MSAPCTIPAQCNTVAVLANLAGYLMRAHAGLDAASAAFYAERIMGLEDAADVDGTRPAVRQLLQESLS